MNHDERTMIVFEACDVMRCGIVQILQSQVKVIDSQARYRPGQSLPACDLILLSDSLHTLDEMATIAKHLSADHTLLVMSERLQANYLQTLIKAGVKGLIHRQDELGWVLSIAVDTVNRGLVYQSPTFTDYLLFSRTMPELGPDDLKVLEGMGQGLTVEDMVKQFGFSRRKVYRIRERLRDVLQVKRSELIVSAAQKQGLLV